MKLSRRALFRAAGGVAFAMPWLESLAQTPPPRRFVALYHPNGVHTEQWTPVPDGLDFKLGPSQSALAPYKNDLLYLQGLDLKCALTGAGEQHQRGLGGLLTGRKIEAGNFTGNDGTTAGWASGISLDQELVKVLGQGSKVGSLQLGVKASERDVSGVLSYSGAAAPLLAQNDPRATFAQLFDGGSPLPADEVEARRLRRTSVLDAVQGQFNGLRALVSVGDRLQLDAHLQRVRELELKLTGMVQNFCGNPAEPRAMAYQTEAAMPEVAQAQLDLLVLALSCDLTRVATVMFSDAKNHIALPFLQIGSDVHNLSHLGDGDMSRLALARRDAWQAEQLAYLLGRLKNTPEGGGTLLDRSLVLWGSEVSRGNVHAHDDMPFLLAGHGTGWQMGRVVRFNARPHNDLLVSVLQGFGSSAVSFGDPAFVTGPLPGL